MITHWKGGMMGELRVLGPEGDIKTIWNPDKKDEVAAAKDQFNKLKKKGYRAFHVDKHGDKAEVMGTFDPDAGKVILVPGIAGG